jgi:hypothetical protein
MNASTILIVAANLLPIAGILWWGWDAFVLLMLYWMETAIIGFWTIVRLTMASPAERGDIRAAGSTALPGRLAIAAFFTVHAGIFMLVHFIFLWTLFAGAWAERIHGPAEFVRVMVIGTDLWIPLLVLFFVRGAIVLGPPAKRLLGLPVAAPAAPVTGQSIVTGLYMRILVMQVTIIVGAWVATLFGSAGALVLLVVAKTLLEVFFEPISRYLIEEAKKAEAED